MVIEENMQEKVQIAGRLIQSFAASEAIKVLRTNVIFSGGENRSLGLTSCDAGEGKTTISLNLAAALASTGKRTILLDTDMRKSILAKYAGMGIPVYGLGQYLTGQCPMGDILYPTDVPYMDIVFSGTRVANPSELLGSAMMRQLVEVLKREYAYIIVDTPPLGQVTDCAVLAPVIDGLLIVINAEKNSYKTVQALKTQYEKTSGKILGVVLNRCDLTDKHSYYRRSYDYRYDSDYRGRRTKGSRKTKN